MEYLVNATDGYNHVHSNKKITVKCPNCSSIKNMQINHLTRSGLSCKVCSDGISLPEKFCINLLKELNINYESQKLFDWSESKRYDFYLKELDIIIECHGIQHYENSNRGRSLKEEQNNDYTKEKLAIDNLNTTIYITIDCRYSTLKHLKNNFIKSLSMNLNLNSVNWDAIWEKSQSSTLVDVCKAYKNGYDVLTLATIFDKNKSTIRKYLHKGNDIGLCDYDSKLELIKSGFIQGKLRGKLTQQYSIDMELIKEYSSVVDASKESNTKKSLIYDCCKNKISSANGFVWKYKIIS